MSLARLLLIVLLVGVALFSWLNMENSLTEPMAQNENNSGLSDHLTNDDLQALHKQIELLKSRISVLEHQQFRQRSHEALIARQGQQTAVSENDEINQMPIDLIELNETAYIEQEQQRIDTLLSTIETSLHNEPVDSQWVTETRAVIADTFASEEFAGADLTNIECRTSLCRVEVLHESMQSVADFDSKWPHKLATVLPNALIDRMELDDGSVSTLIYLARMGYNLPQPENF